MRWVRRYGMSDNINLHYSIYDMAHTQTNTHSWSLCEQQKWHIIKTDTIPLMSWIKTTNYYNYTYWNDSDYHWYGVWTRCTNIIFISLVRVVAMLLLLGDVAYYGWNWEMVRCAGVILNSVNCPYRTRHPYKCKIYAIHFPFGEQHHHRLAKPEYTTKCMRECI